MDAFAYPFRFSGGRAVRVDNASEQYAAQRIAALIQTHYDELPLSPTFGSLDQEFSQFYPSALIQAASNFMPKVRIDDVAEQIAPDGRVQIAVSFTLLE